MFFELQFHRRIQRTVLCLHKQYIAILKPYIRSHPADDVQVRVLPVVVSCVLIAIKVHYDILHEQHRPFPFPLPYDDILPVKTCDAHRHNIDFHSISLLMSWTMCPHQSIWI